MGSFGSESAERLASVYVAVPAGQDRISDFEMKLMDIETEHLGIPSEEYKCTVSMPSGEFQRIVRDLAVIGETCESVEF